MSKNDRMLLRSFMFLPAHNSRFIDKALESEADAIILDMEDAVPISKKEEARAIIIEYSNKGLLNQKKVFIRINHIGTRAFVDDISQLIIPGVYGLMPSKIQNAEDIVFIDKLLSFFEIKNGLEDGQITLAPLIETTHAVNNLTEIARASKRLLALCLGAEDYLNDLGSTYIYQESALIVPRAQLVNASRMNDLLPIDTPYLNVKDIEGFEKDSKIAYKNGFAGRLLLNPKQVESANKMFLPDKEQVEHAKMVIEAVEKANKSGASGVAMLNGAMVGPPMLKRAKTILWQNELAGQK